MNVRLSGLSRERRFLLGIWLLGVLGCFLGLASSPPTGAHGGVPQQALDLVRILTTTALVIVLVLGPGLALRLTQPRRRLELGFVPLPGLAILIVSACIAWALAPQVHPRIVCAVLLAPELAWLLVTLLRAEPEQIVADDERTALLITAAALGIAIARALWSLGPPGELFAGTTFRTLEVGDRSDSRVPFGIVQLIANGQSPFGNLARTYFAGYTFSDRGPLAGLASAPIVLLAGGRPSPAVTGGPWSPFDPQGFMTYRLAMMTFASTVFLSLWTLTRRLGGEKAARFALLLAATTPFLVHEIWFTWPKLLAASLILLSAVTLLDDRPLLAGILLGAAYLAHPLALAFVPVLVLLALWPPWGANTSASPAGEHSRLRWPPRIGPALTLIAGVALCYLGWRLANGSYYTQSSFFSYLTDAGRDRAVRDEIIRALGGHPAPVTLSAWISDRLVSVANTLVPLRLFFFSARDPSINAVRTSCSPLCQGGSPGVVHFFFQYWTGVPFGLGIVFFPLLLQSLWRALRRWPWAVTVTVILPFVGFAIYWGWADTGLLREGLQPWVATLVIVVAVQQQRDRFPWLRSGPVRAVLALRSLEVLLVAVLPTIATRHRLYSPHFVLSDLAAVVAMVALCGFLALMVWRERAADAASAAVPASSRGRSEAARTRRSGGSSGPRG